MAHASMITDMLAGLGRMAIAPVQEVGRAALFFMRGLIHLVTVPLPADKIIDQV